MNKKILFIGSKKLGILVLEKIHEMFPSLLCSIVTINDTEDARSELSNLMRFSKKTGKFLHVLNKSTELFSIVKKEKPDLCIVVGWYWLINNKLLSMVPGGFLGLHGSLLPKYRGNAPLIWPIINGDKKSGLTFFHFDKGMDTGDIIGQKIINIGENETIKDVLNKVEALTIELLEEFYPLIINDTAPRIKQNHNDATYCSQRRPEDGHVNWNLLNRNVHNLIRAQTHPYPGAYSYLNGKKLFIQRSSLFPSSYFGIPGLVVQTIEGKVVVTCGKGAVFLHEVQFEGSTLQAANNIVKYGMKLE